MRALSSATTSSGVAVDIGTAMPICAASLTRPPVIRCCYSAALFGALSARAFDPGGSAGDAVAARLRRPPTESPDQPGVRFVAREGAPIGISEGAVSCQAMCLASWWFFGAGGSADLSVVLEAGARRQRRWGQGGAPAAEGEDVRP